MDPRRARLSLRGFKRRLVIPEQFYDARDAALFGDGLSRTSASHPFCKLLSDIAYDAGRRTGATLHRGGTYVCMEGPQFSTKAESESYRASGFDIIGMTNLQEAKLAREAEICYTTIALVTDYDCWHPDHDSVTVEMIVANLMQNAKVAQQVIANAAEALPIARGCECARALATAIITRPEAIPAATRARLHPLVVKYLK